MKTLSLSSKLNCGLLAISSFLFVFTFTNVHAQLSNAPGTNGIATYINPIQPGEHPDQTMIRVGNDYYSTGSTFHFAPYVPILHSTDMVHWETIARVVPANWSGLASDGTSAGIWQGALAQFGGYFWVYYSNGAGSGQYFSKATNMAGPWSSPTRVTGSTVTGYDNSIFVDDDGTPYMLMKNGQSVNRIQQIDKTTGQVTGTLMNMDWINANNRYSWAEGPVMCKRNGRYYYFMAGNVTGGQYAMSSATLTATESAWTLHGNFFSTASSPGGFTGPNHMTQPVQAPDGTWWCLSHAYDNSGWYGQGRLGLLHQVTFDANGVPHGVPPSTNPVAGPNLPSSNISYNFPKSDYFLTSTLKLDWHFFNKANATKYSLTANPGFIRLSPGTGTTHILQKEGGHYYSLVTKVNLNATATGNQAGLRVMNGKDDLFATLYTGYNGGKKLGFAFNGSATEVNNTIGNVVWLKIERSLHSLSGFYSADGLAWTQVGTAKDVSTLDSYSTNYNEWVGTSIGLYATGITSDFDLFMYRDGFAPIKVLGHNNHYGVTSSSKTPGTVVTNSTTGDWLMLAGVNMGQDGLMSNGVEVNAASSGTGSLEIWIDNIGGTGTKIATVAISSSGGTDTWKTFTANASASGQHDVYLRFVGGSNAFFVNTIRFVPGTPTVTDLGMEEESKSTALVYPNPFENQFSVDVKGAFSYELFGLTGVLMEQNQAQDHVLLGEKLSKGMYVLKLSQGNTTKVVKVTKE
jgi:beta-xylosidase